MLVGRIFDQGGASVDPPLYELGSILSNGGMQDGFADALWALSHLSDMIMLVVKDSWIKSLKFPADFLAEARA